MTLTYEGGSSAARSDVSKRQRMVEASAAAAEFYAEQLRTPDAVTGRRFLSERGFDEAAALAFGGLAHKPWHDPRIDADLTGATPSDALFDHAADLLLEDARVWGSNDFKVPLARRTLRAVLREATGVGA